MAFALVKELGDGSNPNANSYADLDDANSYHASSITAAAWAALTGDKPVSLVQATRILDSACPWSGFPAILSQPLGWPRTDAWKDGRQFAANIVPVCVVFATSELARILLTKGDPTQDSTRDGSISSKTIGPLITEYRAPAGYGDKGAQLDQILPLSVMSLLKPVLGSIGRTSFGTRFASVVRV